MLHVRVALRYQIDLDGLGQRLEPSNLVLPCFAFARTHPFVRTAESFLFWGEGRGVDCIERFRVFGF